MEIRFSNDEDAGFMAEALERAGVRFEGFRAPDSRTLRFRLVDASEADHDKVIRAFYELDADAKVRTARAIYESKDDFEAQFNARNK